MRGGLPAPVVAVEVGFETMMGDCPSRVRNGSQAQCGLPRRRRALFPKRGVGLSETLFPRLEIPGRVFVGYTFGRPTWYHRFSGQHLLPWYFLSNENQVRSQERTP